MKIVNKLANDYYDRKSKAQWVYDKYKSVLEESILDVGADELYLKPLLEIDVYYKGIGFGSNPDLVKIDLEKDSIPFSNNSFNCVICLDVLEHLENIHAMFDKLCALSKRYVLISLPNPWASMMENFESKRYNQETNIKFYGLPKERPEDRHKWFYSLSEAISFVEYRAQKNDMEILDFYKVKKKDAIHSGLSNEEVRKIREARSILFRNDMDFEEFNAWTLWYLLEKKS